MLANGDSVFCVTIEPVKRFVCPEGDWSWETDDEVEGYMRLYLHEELEHRKPPTH
jgi:hypothetical protein